MPVSLNDCKSIFAEHGGTDYNYLEHHWGRFKKAKPIAIEPHW